MEVIPPAGLEVAPHAATPPSTLFAPAGPHQFPGVVLVLAPRAFDGALLALTGPRSRRPAAVIGGAGHGAVFANCAMPYLGLKSAQAVNMFANLRLEGGVSNHLVLRTPPGPFTYLADIAVIEDGGGDSVLEWHRKNGNAMVYYDLLAHLQDRPDVVATFRRNGRRFENVGADHLAEDMAERLHGPWFRKWFHFQPVVLDRPEPCNG